MVTKARVLLVGLEPEIVDYSKSPVPGLTPGQAHIVREQGAIALCGSSMKSMQPSAPLDA